MEIDPIFTNDLSKEIYETTYKYGDEKNYNDTIERLAQGACSIEVKEKQKEFYEKFKFLLHDFKFTPGGRTIANLGIPDRNGTTLYNCFINVTTDIGIEDPDSIVGIYDMLLRQALTLKSEGGYGTNFSWIRPKGNFIYGIGVRTPGVLKFMELWDKSSEIITSGSETKTDGNKKGEKIKIRKGAQMAVLDIWHPEIEEYIIAKQTPGRLTKFNISIGITEGFIKAVQNDKDWDLIFPDTKHLKYKKEWKGDIEDWIERGYEVVIHKTIKAKELWNKILKSTYNRAEPGVIFLDLANKLNPIGYCEKIRSSNPCGEIPNSTGVCNLGSINLAKCIKFINNKPEFNFDLFLELVKLGIRFLDNINDISSTPLPEYKKAAVEKRRIGLGTFGLGSLHYILGIKFGGEESLQLIKKIYKLKAETEILYDAELGKEKGSFPLFDKNKYFNSFWWKNLRISHEIKDQVEKIGHMRNSHRSMNAPTGNTSVLCNNVSSGIEPVFMKEYVRWVIVPESERAELRKLGFEFCNFINGEWGESKHMKFAMRGDEQILKGSFNGKNYEIDKNRGLVRANNIEDYGWKLAKEIYKENIEKMEKQGIFCTTNDLSVDDHLNTLSIISRYTDQACSKTVNIPNNYSFDNFNKIYLEAWNRGIKGITTYRDGTMTAVLEGKNNELQIKENHAPKRPNKLKCDIHFSICDKEQYYVIIGKLNSPYEVFTGLNHYKGNHIIPTNWKEGELIKESKGKYYLCNGECKILLTNGHTDHNCDALTRLVSANLRHGVPLVFLVEQLLKNEGDMFVFSKVIARILKKYIKDGTKGSGNCPECGSKDLIYKDGCISCLCSWSKCS